MPTNASVLAASTSAAQAAAKAIGGTYADNSGKTGGYVAGSGAADPAISSSPVRRYTTDPSTGVGANSTVGQQNAIISSLNTNPVDENAIRAQMLAQAQGQIDAINNSYDAIIAKNKQTGVENAGKTRAGAARGGLLGSDFGDAAIKTDAAETDQTIAGNNADRATAISNALAGVNTRADAAIVAAKNTLQTNQQEKLKYLQDTATASRADAITLAKSGVSLDKLSDTDYNNLLDQTGYTPDQLKAQFVLNQPDPIYKGVSGSKYLVVTRNPTTGAVKSDSFDLGFTPPQDYNSTTLDTGQIIFTPKNWDGDPKKIITYGAPSAKYNSEVASNYASANANNALADQRKGGGNTEYKIGASARNDLLKFGLPAPQINQLESDIQTYGLKKALDGLDPNTQSTIQTILDKNYVVSG